MASRSADIPAYVLAFDTSNEVISIALGRLLPEEKAVECVAWRQVAAHRASNTQLIPCIDTLLQEQGVPRESIACVACGRGPGSFTGVRICIATAKGVASALEVPLVGLSTLDALAWELQASGVRGRTLVVADAMRKEVYPQVYDIGDEDIGRTGADSVVAATAFSGKATEGIQLSGQSAAGGEAHWAFSVAAELGRCKGLDASASAFDVVAGDALVKYADIFGALGPLAPETQWRVNGPGLLAALQAMWQAGECDPFDANRHDPAILLPIYTRLSDAEEHERLRAATLPNGGTVDASIPPSGTLGPSCSTARHEGRSLHQLGLSHSQGETLLIDVDLKVFCRPFAAADIDQVVALEAACMGTDGWHAAQLADELGRADRTWWVATDSQNAVVAYAGGQVVDGQLQVFKVACAPELRRSGIARSLLARLAEDARNLGADAITLEVRASNEDAQAFYRALGFEDVGARPGYYSDGEDALIMSGPLMAPVADVAGMQIHSAVLTNGEKLDAAASALRILAIESSCDETAAAVIDGNGVICSDTVASQIDFHARFGGVVPEIASRKHIEAICGVAQVCLERAGGLRYRNLSAVACTYAPGLVGALVVGVAFAKGVAWGANIPYIQVNHLEGHLYASKFTTPDFAPPAVVSLVSGGHTMLVHMRDWGSYEVLGSTIDDAVGEAFDKVAKALGLGYPGGPVISRYAQAGNPRAIDFPRAMLHSHDLRFSLSGLKTAVITYINQQLAIGAELDIPDIAASFQAAVIDVQVAKAKDALLQTGAKEFCLGGGVAANPALRVAYMQLCEELDVRLTLPPASACTDNAAMIALVALDRYAQGKFAGLDADAFAQANLEEPY